MFVGARNSQEEEFVLGSQAALRNLLGEEV
jgi:hypothetical protein